MQLLGRILVTNWRQICLAALAIAVTTVGWSLPVRAKVGESPTVVIVSSHNDYTDTYVAYADGAISRDRISYGDAKDPYPCGDGQFWILNKLPPHPLGLQAESTFTDSALLNHPIDSAVIEQANSANWEYDIEQRRSRDIVGYCVYIVTGMSIDDLYELRLAYFEGPYHSVTLESPHTRAILQWLGGLNRKVLKVEKTR